MSESSWRYSVLRADSLSPKRMCAAASTNWFSDIVPAVFSRTWSQSVDQRRWSILEIAVSYFACAAVRRRVRKLIRTWASCESANAKIAM